MRSQTQIIESLGREKELALREIGRVIPDAALVGGAVRDLLLGIAGADTDILVPDGLSALLENIEREGILSIGVKEKLYFPKYRTGKLRFTEDLFPGCRELDFAAYRHDEYPTPGEPPVVTPGTLEQDVYRRDFSVNALLMSLAPGSFGEIVDRCGGVDDLEKRQLRILHEKSFEDDPVRLLRGERFRVRFGFEYAPDTVALADEACQRGFLTGVPAFRRFDELRKILQEEKREAILKNLSSRGLLSQLSELLVVPERLPKDWEQAMGALFASADEGRVREFFGHARYGGKKRDTILQARREFRER